MKNVLITGASSGLGKATALQLAQSGYRVFAGVRNEADAAELQRLHPSISPVQLDLSYDDQIASAARFVDRACGADGLSLLINMAGYMFFAPVEHTDLNKARQLFDVLTFSPVALSNALMPALKRYASHHAAADRRAKIFNIISWASLDASPWTAFYAAAKAALLRISQAQNLELRHLGIDAVAILPGTMRTPMVTEKSASQIQLALSQLSEQGRQDYAAPMQHMARMASDLSNNRFIPTPDTIARKIVAIASKENLSFQYKLGTDTYLVDALNKFAPTCLFQKAKRAMFGLPTRVA